MGAASQNRARRPKFAHRFGQPYMIPAGQWVGPFAVTPGQWAGTGAKVRAAALAELKVRRPVCRPPPRAGELSPAHAQASKEYRDHFIAKGIEAGALEVTDWAPGTPVDVKYGDGKSYPATIEAEAPTNADIQVRWVSPS